MYPRLCIERGKIAANVRRITELCGRYGIEITGITKAFAGDPEIAKLYLQNGIRRIGDSRIANLERMRELDCEKWLIRMPAVSEAESVVQCADVSLNSELDAIKALEKACEKLGKTHKIVLMYDLGDLREGYVNSSEIGRTAEYIKSSGPLELYGIGTNLTCFSFVQPDTEKLSRLVEIGREIGAERFVSGGNSATLDLMLKGGIPKGVNLLRLGESLLFGRERANYKYIDGTYNDGFIMQAEIIELKDKPSLPWGTFGVDSYGNTRSFTDKGIRRRAICALGKQDTDVETMWPMDGGIEILGGSSDHLVVDVTDTVREYQVGDIVEFRLGYFALMRAYTSHYVEKAYR